MFQEPEPTKPPIRPLSAPREFLPEDSVGEYRIERELSRGGMGVVYVAQDNLGRQVALKTIRLRDSTDGRARALFLREARVAATIQDDYVVPIYGYGEHAGVSFIVMPLLLGMTLDSRMRAEKQLPLLDAVRIGADIASGLVAIHTKRLIHRDIKPSNVWLTAGTGRAKIFDFGISRPLDTETDRLTQPGEGPGTPGFMAPEQARVSDIDGRADLYSLGCTLYMAMTGLTPYQGSPNAQLIEAATRDPIPPKEIRAEIPTTLSRYVCRLMARSPDQRPPSAGQVLNDLRQIENWFVRKAAAVRVNSSRPPTVESKPILQQGEQVILRAS